MLKGLAAGRACLISDSKNIVGLAKAGPTLGVMPVGVAEGLLISPGFQLHLTKHYTTAVFFLGRIELENFVETWCTGGHTACMHAEHTLC